MCLPSTVSIASRFGSSRPSNRRENRLALIRVCCAFIRHSGGRGAVAIITYLSGVSLAKRPFATQPTVCVANRGKCAAGSTVGRGAEAGVDAIPADPTRNRALFRQVARAEGPASLPPPPIVSLGSKNLCSKPAAKLFRSSGQRRRRQPQDF